MLLVSVQSAPRFALGDGPATCYWVHAYLSPDKDQAIPTVEVVMPCAYLALRCRAHLSWLLKCVSLQARLKTLPSCILMQVCVTLLIADPLYANNLGNPTYLPKSSRQHRSNGTRVYVSLTSPHSEYLACSFCYAECFSSDNFLPKDRPNASAPDANAKS